MTTNNQDGLLQITFHFVNDQTECFNVNVLQQGDSSLTLPEFQNHILQHLDKSWCILHLPEQIIGIKTANVLKVEMKPALGEIRVQECFLMSDE
jgi:hypothetical protein